MSTTHLSTVIRRSLRTLAATAVVLASLMVGSLPVGAQTDTSEPSAAFCQAWADYQDAQDGAQLNTALGAMQDALTPDAPAEVAEALVTLGQGDLDPAEVLAASDTVAAWADEPCAAQSTTTTAPPSTETTIAPTSSTTTTASTTTTTASTSSTTAPPTTPTTASTTSTTTDSDEGEAPTGGVDTGAGGTATGSGPNGFALLGATIAVVAGGVGAAAANRRRLATRR